MQSIKCVICQYSTVDLENYFKHLNGFNTLKIAFICGICSKRVERFPGLRKHMQKCFFKAAQQPQKLKETNTNLCDKEII